MSHQKFLKNYLNVMLSLSKHDFGHGLNHASTAQHDIRDAIDCDN